MNKNYLIIGLIILALIVIGVIASRSGNDPIVENNNTPETVEESSLEVSDQELVGNEIVIDRIEATEDGFVAVTQTPEDGEETVVGSAPVATGVNDSVVVTLEDGIEDGVTLTATLHNDTGLAGEFEYSADNTEVDTPVTVDNEVVSESFTVSVEDTTETEETPVEPGSEAEDTTETSTEEETEAVTE